MEKRKLYSNVPVYSAIVTDDGLGMERISLVDDPAMESDFQFFANEEDRFKFSVQNEDQHILFGVVIRADHPVLRISAEGFPYYITFSKETIKTIAQKYFRDGNQNNFNLMHTPGTEVNSVEMLQFFIKDIDNPRDLKTLRTEACLESSRLPMRLFGRILRPESSRVSQWRFIMTLKYRWKRKKSSYTVIYRDFWTPS